MSRVHAAVIVLGMAFALPAHAIGQSSLAGTWQSAPDEMRLSAPHQEAVWGKNASEVRTVRLSVRPTGAATLTVTRKVVDARRRTVPGTTSIEEVELTVGIAPADSGIRVDLPVTVKRAERRYPGDPAGTWTIEGLRVVVTTFPDDASRLEVRLDFPDGRGSFWETLRRGAKST
jgi:hypothetical protein